MTLTTPLAVTLKEFDFTSAVLVLSSAPILALPTVFNPTFSSHPISKAGQFVVVATAAIVEIQAPVVTVAGRVGLIAAVLLAVITL